MALSVNAFKPIKMDLLCNSCEAWVANARFLWSLLKLIFSNYITSWFFDFKSIALVCSDKTTNCNFIQILLDITVIASTISQISARIWRQKRQYSNVLVNHTDSNEQRWIFISTDTSSVCTCTTYYIIVVSPLLSWLFFFFLAPCTLNEGSLWV